LLNRSWGGEGGGGRQAVVCRGGKGQKRKCAYRLLSDRKKGEDRFEPLYGKGRPSCLSGCQSGGREGEKKKGKIWRNTPTSTGEKRASHPVLFVTGERGTPDLPRWEGANGPQICPHVEGGKKGRESRGRTECGCYGKEKKKKGLPLLSVARRDRRKKKKRALDLLRRWRREKKKKSGKEPWQPAKKKRKGRVASFRGVREKKKAFPHQASEGGKKGKKKKKNTICFFCRQKEEKRGVPRSGPNDGGGEKGGGSGTKFPVRWKGRDRNRRLVGNWRGGKKKRLSYRPTGGGRIAKRKKKKNMGGGGGGGYWFPDPWKREKKRGGEHMGVEVPMRKRGKKGAGLTPIPGGKKRGIGMMTGFTERKEGKGRQKKSRVGVQPRRGEKKERARLG